MAWLRLRKASRLELRGGDLRGSPLPGSSLRTLAPQPNLSWNRLFYEPKVRVVRERSGLNKKVVVILIGLILASAIFITPTLAQESARIQWVCNSAQVSQNEDGSYNVVLTGHADWWRIVGSAGNAVAGPQQSNIFDNLSLSPGSYMGQAADSEGGPWTNNSCGFTVSPPATPPATSTPPVTEPVITVSPTLTGTPIATQTEEATETREPGGGMVCVMLLDHDLAPAVYAQYKGASGKWVPWDGWVLVKYKEEIGLFEISLRAHRGAPGFGRFLISYESGLKTLEVEVTQSGDNCQIIFDEPEPTPITTQTPVFLDSTDYLRQVTDASNIHYGANCTGAWTTYSNAVLLGVEVNGEPVKFVDDGSRAEIQLSVGIHNVVFRFLGLEVPFLATIEPCAPVFQALALRARTFERGDYQLLDANVSGLDSERNDPMVDTKSVQIESVVFIKDGLQVTPSALEIRGHCAFYDFEDRTGDFWAIVNDEWRIEIPEGYTIAPVSDCYYDESTGLLHLVPGVNPEIIWRSLGMDAGELYRPDDMGKTPLYYWRELYPITPHYSGVHLPHRWVELLNLS